MSGVLDPELSVIIPTRDRAARLERMLRSLDAAIGTTRVPVEVILVDNGSTDNTSSLANRWAAGGPLRRCIAEPQPGRARAMNRALPLATAPLVAFTDDDIEVAPDWLEAIVVFFKQNTQFAAAMGRVRLPPTVIDPAVHGLARHYRGTIPLYDQGDTVGDAVEMYGCNMVVRRSVFDAVGGFDDRLGVGASGLCEDADLAARIRNAGLRIGYMPTALVYHELDTARLTPAAFRDFHVRWARSRYVTEPPRPWQPHFWRMVDAALSIAWWSLTRRPERRMQALGRLIRQRELLRLRRAAPVIADETHGN